MQLDRDKFTKAAKFLKPAILKADEEESNMSKNIREKTFVHVKMDGDKCQLTAYDGHCGKRVMLEKPPQLMLEPTVDQESTEPEQEFLIPRETLEAFEVLCTKHKAKFEKVSKRDHSLNLIEIGPHSLDSHKDTNNYLQPVGVTFPNIDPLFFAPGLVVQNIKMDPFVAIDALKEFNNQVEVTFSGQNGSIYIATEDKTYQAFFMPVSQRVDDE